MADPRAAVLAAVHLYLGHHLTPPRRLPAAFHVHPFVQLVTIVPLISDAPRIGRLRGMPNYYWFSTHQVLDIKVPVGGFHSLGRGFIHGEYE